MTNQLGDERLREIEAFARAGSIGKPVLGEELLELVRGYRLARKHDPLELFSSKADDGAFIGGMMGSFAGSLLAERLNRTPLAATSPKKPAAKKPAPKRTAKKGSSRT